MEPKPRPPETAPRSLVDDLEQQDPRTLEDLAEWLDELIAYKQQPPREEVEDRVPDDASLKGRDEESGGWVYSKMIPCGKDRCRSCPHGPYLYRFYYDDTGNLTSEYVGKVDE